MFILAGAMLPVVVTAQVTPPSDFRGVVELVLRFLQGLTAVAWIFLFFFFIYGVLKFLMNFDDERTREEGKRSMVFTLVATAVLFMVWGIITFLMNSVFGTGTFGIPFLTAPQPSATP